MANTLQRVTGEASTLGASIATVPVGATWTIIGCRFANKDNISPHTVEVTINGVYVSGAETTLPIGSALDIMIGSKIVATEGDEIVVTSDADSVVDVYISFLQQD